MEPKVAEPTPPRVPLDVDVECKIEGLAPTTFQSMNLSEGGIFIKSAFPLELSSPVHCTFRLPDEGPQINVEGEVAWTRSGPPEQIPPPGMGIRFYTLSPQDAARVRRHVELMEQELMSEESPETSSTNENQEDQSPGELFDDMNYPEDGFYDAPTAHKDLIVEGERLHLFNGGKKKYTGHVRKLTPDGLALEIPLEGLENKNLLFLSHEGNEDEQNSTQVMVKNAELSVADDSLKMVLNLVLKGSDADLIQPDNHNTRRNDYTNIPGPLQHKNETTIPGLPLFQELSPPEELTRPPVSTPPAPPASFREDELPDSPPEMTQSTPSGAQGEDQTFYNEESSTDPEEEWSSEGNVQDDYVQDSDVQEHDDDLFELDNNHSYGVSCGPEDFNRTDVEHISPRRPKKQKHSGIVDFKSRISKNPRRRSRTQIKPVSRKAIALFGGMGLAIIMVFTAILYAWKSDDKPTQRKKAAKQAKTTQKQTAKNQVTLDPHAVELPTATAEENPGIAPPLPASHENKLTASTAPSSGNTETKSSLKEKSPSSTFLKIAKKAEVANRWTKEPQLSKKGANVSLILPTKAMPKKITHYWMANPPGIVVDLHGVDPVLKPGRYTLKDKGARLLKVTKNNGRARFIVYFNSSVNKKGVEVQKEQGGGSLTWRSKGAGRKLSQKKSPKNKAKIHKSPKSLTLAD